MLYRRWILPAVIIVLGVLRMVIGGGFDLALFVVILFAVVFYGWIWPKRHSASP